MKLIDSIQWIQDGERANAVVLNRSLKQLVNIIDSNDLNATVTSSGVNISPDLIDPTLKVGDLVTVRADGKYYPAGIDDTIIGVYALDGDIASVKLGGIITGTDFVVGSKYYVDLVNIGAYTLDPISGIQIGTAISSTEIVLSSGVGSSTTASGMSSVNVPSSLLGANVVEDSLVYLALDGKYYPAQGVDAIKSAVIGIYQNGAINFSGVIELNSLIPGKKYYLSQIAGNITSIYYDGAILVGTAISTTSLLMQIGTGTTSASTPTSTAQLLKQLFTATEGQTSIAAEYNPNYLFVYSEGILLSPDFYIATDGLSITFTEPLKAGEIIQVSSLVVGGTASTKASTTNIFTATEGQTEFFVAYDVGAIDIYISGMYTSPVNYIATNGTSIILNSPCTLGDEVVINTYAIVVATTSTTTASGSTAIVITETDFTATEGQTIFNVNYTVGKVSVYMSGIKLRNTDFIAIDGTSIELANPSLLNEWVHVQSYSTETIIATTSTGIIETDFTATEGQTIFNVNYTIGKVAVYVGGIKLRNTDFIAINGTSIELLDSSLLNEWVQVQTW